MIFLRKSLVNHWSFTTQCPVLSAYSTLTNKSLSNEIVSILVDLVMALSDNSLEVEPNPKGLVIVTGFLMKPFFL